MRKICYALSKIGIKKVIQFILSLNTKYLRHITQFNDGAVLNTINIRLDANNPLYFRAQ